jgi:Arc/MetJ-type ribon-helix-helix transcriptional regulator
MTIEIDEPEVEQRVRQQIESGHFQDVSEFLTKALEALEREYISPVPQKKGRTCEEAVDHMLEARKGHRLPEGMSIRDLINKGRV